MERASEFFVRPHSAGWLRIQRVKTNKNGKFATKDAPAVWRKWFSSKRLDDNAPLIMVRKSGYILAHTHAKALTDKDINFFAEREMNYTWFGGGIIEGYNDLLLKLNNEPKDENEN